MIGTTVEMLYWLCDNMRCDSILTLYCMGKIVYQGKFYSMPKEYRDSCVTVFSMEEKVFHITIKK